MASEMLSIEADEAGRDNVGRGRRSLQHDRRQIQKITGLGDGCRLSVPTVITGGDYSLHSLATALLYENLARQGCQGPSRQSVFHKAGWLL
jgi:hypothetical protein